MNNFKAFFITLLVLALLTALPFLLMPELMNDLDQLGIRIPCLTVISILLIILSLPRKKDGK